MHSLKNLREKRGFTQSYMAESLGVAVSTYNQYETGSRNIPRNVAMQVSILLSASLDEIFLPTKFTISKPTIEER